MYICIWQDIYIQYAWKLRLLFSFFTRFIELFSDFIAHKHVGWLGQAVPPYMETEEFLPAQFWLIHDL